MNVFAANLPRAPDAICAVMTPMSNDGTALYAFIDCMNDSSLPDVHEFAGR